MQDNEDNDVIQQGMRQTTPKGRINPQVAIMASEGTEKSLVTLAKYNLV